MAEITATEHAEYKAFTALNVTPEEAGKRFRELEAVKSEAAERRKKLKEAETRIAELEKAVPEGAVILTGDDAKAHAALVAAGKTLKQVDDDLKRLGELETKDRAREREDSVRKAAKAEGLDPDQAVRAFANLAGADALTFEDGEVQVQGKQDKQPAGFVTVDGKKVRLGEWLASEHPYLNLAAENGAGGNGGGVREVPEMRGKAPAGGGGGATALERAKEANRAAAQRPNALRPAPTA